MSNNGGRRHRLVLFPSPFQGHITPMLQLATILHTKGFSITILHTCFNSPKPANHPHFHFVPIEDGFSDQLLVSSTDVSTVIEALNTHCEAPFRDQIKRLQSESAGEPITCVIMDALLYSLQAVAVQLGLPVLVLRTTSAACVDIYIKYPMLWEKGYLPIKDSQLEVEVSEVPCFRVKDLPYVKENPQGMRQMIARMVEAMRASSGVIINTFEELEPTYLLKIQQGLSVPVFPIGPLHKQALNTESSLLAQDRSCIEWLDKQAPKSVIYVSFGSTANVDEKELIETAWALTNSHCPFLWVLRDDSVRGPKHVSLPKELEEDIRMRGKIVKWAPQEEVLSHPAVGVFWTHSGWNSTLESICEGIPMLCWPYFTDQPVNARFVSHVWKVGIQLEDGLEREKIEKAIRSVIADRQGGSVTRRTQLLKENAVRSIQEGGASHESLVKLVNYLSSF